MAGRFTANGTSRLPARCDLSEVVQTIARYEPVRLLARRGSGYREAIEHELSTRLKQGQSAPAAAVSAEPLPRECTACQTVNDLDAAFCKRCGMALGAVH